MTLSTGGVDALDLTRAICEVEIFDDGSFDDLRLFCRSEPDPLSE